MNRPAPHSRRIPYIVAGTALFALLAFLLSQTGYYSFCYLEQWDTFIYNSAYLSGSFGSARRMRTTPFKLPDPILLPTPDRNIDNSTATDVDCTADSRHPAPLDKKQTHITTRPFPRCSIVLPALQRKLPIHRNHSLPVDAAFPPPAVLLPQVHRTVCLFSCKHLPALRNGRTGRLSVQLPHTDHRIVLSQEEGTLVHIPSANGVPDR